MCQTIFNTFGDFDFAFPGQQFDGTHLTHVHTHRVGGTAKLAVYCGERGGGFFGGIFVSGDGVVDQQGVSIRRHFMHGDAHVIDHANNALDLLRIDDFIGQVVIDLGIGQEALFLAFGDQQLKL